MATHVSAEKRHRQNVKRRDRNRNAKSTIRTAVKNALVLIEKGDLKGAQESAKAAVRLLDKAVSHGVLHKNNAARRVSRLTSRLSAAEKKGKK